MIRIVQLLISLALLYWAISGIDLSDVGEHLTGIHWPVLLACIPVIIADRWLMSSKWRLLLSAQNIHASEWKCFRIYAMSNFVGLFLPATVGADFSRIAIARYEKLPIPGITSSIVIERLLGFAALIFLTIVGAIVLILFFGNIEFDVQLVLSSAALVLAGFLGVIAFSFSRTASNIVNFLTGQIGKTGNLGEKLGHNLREMHSTYLTYSGKKLVLIAFFLLSCLEGILMIVLAYLVALSLNIDVNFIYLASSVSVVIFLVRLPVSIDGFGIYEKGIQFFLVQAGVTASLGLAAGVLYHVVCLAGILPGGLLLALYRKPDDKNQVSEVKSTNV